MTLHKTLIKFIKSKNYEPLLHELSEYNVTKFKGAEFHFSLYVDKYIFIRSATIKYDNFGNPLVLKDIKREKTNILSSLKHDLEIECVLKFEYTGKLDIKNYERIDFFYFTAYLYKEENFLVVYFRYTQPIEKKVYL